ncbi:glycosyltransferase [uncultured Polaribacter sp.]|uniref:glycosyltransferase n=1 Tax=uncultured Polaribacter sp. TaxID=174711 RepID=UPI002620D7C7|nr:glycosyltransferase [uncultured Polaribacter sp.]
MITASIVTYKESLETLQTTVDSFLKTPLQKKLFIIDNSPENEFESKFKHAEIEYIFTDKNLGFGKAHNLILDKIDSKFHLVLNPDIIFPMDVIPKLIHQLNKEKVVSFITPRVTYPNGKLQYICRKHPTFFDLMNRKIKISKKQIFENEYRNQDLEKSFYPDFIHGCFMLFKTEDFIRLRGFDERYFLYLEDADICRKIDVLGKKKMYYPEAEIIHLHQKGSSKRLKLFFRHLSSAIKYFLKWGF